MLRTLVAAALIAGAQGCATGAPERAVRSAQVRAQFVRAHPCPLTGLPRGACRGWIVDHREPLCAGGADHADNLQWITAEQARVKDVADRARCRALRLRGL